MGGPAALAYQIASGLISNVGAFQSAGTRAESQVFMPDRSAFDAGIDAYQKSIDSEYDAANKQAELLLQDFQYEAARQGEQYQTWEATTAQAYNASGVTQDGSPLTILAHGRALKQQEINLLESRSVALANLTQQRGLIAANEGRAKIAQLQADYFGRSAQIAGLAGADKFADQNRAGYNVMSLLGSSVGLLSGTAFGNKFKNLFKSNSSGSPVKFNRLTNPAPLTTPHGYLP